MSDVKGFVKAKGKKIINGEGKEILLKGVGLGGWLLPEGYMWCLPKKGDRPRTIEKMVEELVGKEKSLQFWDTYFQRYTSESDIRQISIEGFNSIRVPINSRRLLAQGGKGFFNEDHLKLIDNVIEWCKKYELYVILDLHGAPGGQTGDNIDDSEKNLPELFTDEENRRRTIEIWRRLAERYKDEWIVAGYDLLNEPLPEWFSSHNSQVMPLYADITKAIREVDKEHMIMLEGVHWATDWSIFNEAIDGNMMLQFHKYWNNPDTESIRAFLDKREELGVPIFMGEGGENNKDWFAGAFRLYEDHDISWNFWTWKKMNRDNSPCSVNMPEGWQRLGEYLEGRLKAEEVGAEKILWEYLDNISFERCTYHPEVVRALFRRPSVRIPAIFYGYRGKGISYGVGDPSEDKVGFRVNDGMDIRFMESERTKANFQHMGGTAWATEDWMYLRLSKGDWAAYEFNAEANSGSASFIVELCVQATGEEGVLSVSLDDGVARTMYAKGGSWETVRLEGYSLEEGMHRVVLKGEKNSVGIKWIQVLA